MPCPITHEREERDWLQSNGSHEPNTTAQIHPRPVLLLLVLRQVGDASQGTSRCTLCRSHIAAVACQTYPRTGLHSSVVLVDRPTGNNNTIILLTLAVTNITLHVSPPRSK